MKFVLTSEGLVNKEIVDAAIRLVGKPVDTIRVAFVPTAANVEEGDKNWLEEDVRQFKAQQFASFDSIDIATASRDEWEAVFSAADLICFGGGNEPYLARVLQESGVAAALPELLKTRVYMGVSAGSMVAGQFLTKEMLLSVYPETVFKEPVAPPLGLVNLIFIPHLDSEWFPMVRKEVLEKITPLSAPLYALDDYSALAVVDGVVEVIGAGAYLKLE